MRQNSAVKFVVPKGWTQPFKIEGADNHVYWTGLVRGKTEITFFLTSNTEVRYPPQDSRRLVWWASRYASTWNLLLFQWSNTLDWNVYQTKETYRTGSRLLVSGASPRYEFFCIAYVKSPSTDTDQDILATLEELFRSTKDVSGQPFARLTTRDLRARRVSPPIEGDRWTIGNDSVRIPSGWIEYGMILPSGLVLVSEPTHPNSLDLNRRDFRDSTAQKQSLLIMWIRGNDITRGNNRQIAINWESHVKRWQTQPDILTNPEPIQGRDREVFVGVTNKTRSLHSDKLLWPAWVYKSASLVMFAHGSTLNADSVGMMEDAVTDVIKQLIR